MTRIVLGLSLALSLLVTLLPSAASAQPDGGTDAAADDASTPPPDDGGALLDGAAPGDAAISDATVPTDGPVEPVDASRPVYPLLEDDGGRGWICAVSDAVGAKRGSAPGLLLGTIALFSLWRRRARQRRRESEKRTLERDD